MDFLDDWLRSHEALAHGLKTMPSAAEIVRVIRYEDLTGIQASCGICRALFQFTLRASAGMSTGARDAKDLPVDSAAPCSQIPQCIDQKLSESQPTPAAPHTPQNVTRSSRVESHRRLSLAGRGYDGRTPILFASHDQRSARHQGYSPVHKL